MEKRVARHFSIKTRDEFLAGISFAWRAQSVGGGFSQWSLEVEDPQPRVVIQLDADIKEGDFATRGEAEKCAMDLTAERLEAFIAAQRAVRFPYGITAYLSKHGRKAMADRKKRLEYLVTKQAAYAAGKGAVAVFGVKPKISFERRLEVGTQLWLVSAPFPFDGNGPELIPVIVVECDEEENSVYEGGWSSRETDVSYRYTVAVPPRKGGWDGPQGRMEHNKHFNLDNGPLPEELPWNISGERIFTTKGAACAILLDLAEKCQKAAQSDIENQEVRGTAK